MLLALSDIRPNGEFLSAVEQKATIRVALFPCCTHECLPVGYFWCGPGCKALVAAPSMELRPDGTRGTVAGCNHKTTLAQPCVDIGP